MFLNQIIGEASLGDYPDKARASQVQAIRTAMSNIPPEERNKAWAVHDKRKRGLERAQPRIMKSNRARQEQALRDKYAGVDIDAEIAQLQPAVDAARNDAWFGASNTYSKAEEKYSELSHKLKELQTAKSLLSQGVVEAKMSPQQQHDFDRMRAGAMSRKEYDAKWKKPRKSDDEVIYGKRKSVAEMDKSQPSHGRDGHVSHSTYGSRDKGGSQGQDRTARATKAEKMMKHAHDVMMKSMSTADKVKKGWRNPNIDEGSETAADIDKKIEFHKQGQAAAQYKGSMNKMHAAKIRELEAKKKQQGVAEVSDRDPGALASRAHIASQERKHQAWAAKQKELEDEFYANHPELDDRHKTVDNLVKEFSEMLSRTK